jgi:hypothetical protein
MEYLNLLLRFGSVVIRDSLCCPSAKRTGIFSKIFARKNWDLLLQDTLTAIHPMEDWNPSSHTSFVMRCVALDH